MEHVTLKPRSPQQTPPPHVLEEASPGDPLGHEAISGTRPTPRGDEASLHPRSFQPCLLAAPPALDARGGGRQIPCPPQQPQGLRPPRARIPGQRGGPQRTRGPRLQDGGRRHSPRAASLTPPPPRARPRPTRQRPRGRGGAGRAQQADPARMRTRADIRPRRGSRSDMAAAEGGGVRPDATAQRAELGPLLATALRPGESW